MLSKGVAPLCNVVSCVSLVLMDSKTFIEAFEAENFHFGSGILWFNSTLPLNCSITSTSAISHCACAVIRHDSWEWFPRVQRGEERSWPQCPLHCCGGCSSCSGDSCRRSCILCTCHLTTLLHAASSKQLASHDGDSSLIMFSADITSNQLWYIHIHEYRMFV